MNNKISQLLNGYDDSVQELAITAVQLVREVVPEAREEVDETARLVGFTFMPSTYKGLFVAIAPQKDYVNIMFAKGAQLLESDTTHLLEGTGKLARHIKIRDEKDLQDPAIKALVTRAAEMTPRN